MLVSLAHLASLELVYWFTGGFILLVIVNITCLCVNYCVFDACCNPNFLWESNKFKLDNLNLNFLSVLKVVRRLGCGIGCHPL